MGTPQYIWITLTIIGLMIASHEHGKPKTGVNSVHLAIANTALLAALLWWGGFFG